MVTFYARTRPKTGHYATDLDLLPVRDIQAEGVDYDSARETLDALVPAGWVLLWISTWA